MAIYENIRKSRFSWRQNVRKRYDQPIRMLNELLYV